MKDILKSILVGCLVVFLLATPVLSQEGGEDSLHVEDRWLAFDKVQHVTFSFLWVLSTQYVAVNKFHLTEEEAFPVSVTSAAVTGLLKEIRDARRPDGYFSKRDLVANTVGLLLGSAVVLVWRKK
ncbi:MAG: hypothetical protein ACE5HZ_05435 [Fidelibacterota bacterium]